FVAVMVIAGVFASHAADDPKLIQAPAKEIQAAPAPQSPLPRLVQTGPRPEPTAYTAIPRARYNRPELAPNGQPWPPVSGYLDQHVDPGGNSAVTVDNTQSSSDMVVKLFDRSSAPPKPIRVFFLRAREQFVMEMVAPGSYDIRYRDLDSGLIFKSQPFTLHESQNDIQLPDRVRHEIQSTDFH